MKTFPKILSGIVALLALTVSSSLVAQNSGVADPKSMPGGLVKLSLIVTDRSNHSLDEARKEDVQVFEGETQQTIVLFEKDERPIDYAIAVDTSGSLKSLLRPMLEAVTTIVNNKRTLDEIFLLRFVSSNQIETAQDFTTDKELLLGALKDLRIEGGQTALIDAVYLAVDHTAKHEDKERRKAVVVLTDGEDRSSFYTLEKLVKLLRETNVQVFVIGLVMNLDKEGGLIRPSPRDRAEKFLTILAAEGRGRLFLPKNVTELQKATAEIVHDLHSQFVVGYYSTTDAGKTGFRKVEVKLVKAAKAEKLEVIAPRGYHVGIPASNSKP